MSQKKKDPKTILQPENCGSCCHNVISRDEPICGVFNSPVELFVMSVVKFECNSYERNAMIRFDLEKEIDGKMYILWDHQYSASGAEFSASVIQMRAPDSDPKIISGDADTYGVYVLKEMS